MAEGVEAVLNDPQMRHFVQAESQKIKFQALVHKLTEQCWDMCMGYPGKSLDRKTENCMLNCVERFIDTSEFVVKKLEKEGEQHLASAGGSDSGGGYKWQ